MQFFIPKLSDNVFSLQYHIWLCTLNTLCVLNKANISFGLKSHGRKMRPALTTIIFMTCTTKGYLKPTLNIYMHVNITTSNVPHSSNIQYKNKS